MASCQNFTKNPAASSANQNLAVRVKTEPDDEKTTLGQEHSHLFSYQINMKNHMVTCTEQCTVLEALQKKSNFKSFFKKNRTEGKDIIIERDSSPIATHFPCRLLKDKEIVLIKCYPCKAAEVPDGYEIKDGDIVSRGSDIVTFYINTIGGSNMKSKNFLKNQKLKSYKSLCIYAYIGETVEDALKRDGRFTDLVFQESISLCEEGVEKTNIELNTAITQDFNGLKSLKLQNKKAQRQAEDKTADAKRKPASSKNSDPSSNTGNPSTSSAPGGSKPSSDKAMADKGPDLYKKVHEIPDSTEILEILCEQFQGLVELMKKRHKKTKVDVVELLREEFGKNIQGFSEISTIKKLMDMSASVCYIEVENHMTGTGFLLFDRYILTNAHVIKDITNGSVLGRKVRVTFAFEGLSEKYNNLWFVKQEVVAGRFDLEHQKRVMDFVLLELDDSLGKPDLKLPPALLGEYSPLPGKGGICLIGHPHGGVKKMDSSSIIEVKERGNAVKRQFGRKGRHIQYINDLKDKELANKELTYNTCFFHGSSGSPIFGENCQLVGLHTGGYPYKIAGEQKHVIEYGISMRSILEDLLIQIMEKGKCDLLSKLIAEAMMSKSTIQVVAEFIWYMLRMWKEDLDSVLSTVITTAKDCGGSSELRTSLCEIIPADDLQTLMHNPSSSKSLSELSEILREEETPMETDQQTAGN